MLKDNYIVFSCVTVLCFFDEFLLARRFGSQIHYAFTLPSMDVTTESASSRLHILVERHRCQELLRDGHILGIVMVFYHLSQKGLIML